MHLSALRLGKAKRKQAQTTHAPNGRQKCLIEIASPLFGVRKDKTTLHDMQDLHLSKYTQTHYTGYSAPKHICVSACLILSFVEILPISERRTRAKAQIESVASAELAQADMTEHAELLQSS